jgi:hypothetical protein
MIIKHARQCKVRDPDRYRETVISNECSLVANAPADTANDTLNNAAFGLGQLVADGVLDRQTVEAQLFEAARERRIPLFEARSTIKSGLDAGERNPRGLDGQPTAAVSARKTRLSNDEQGRRNRAKQTLRTSQPIAGTLGEIYLRTRGISVTDEAASSLRFHQALLKSSLLPATVVDWYKHQLKRTCV